MYNTRRYYIMVGLKNLPYACGKRQICMISIIILIIVFILIAIRQVGNVRLQIWQIMLLGALGVLLSGQISPLKAIKSINPDVMFFLFGVFIVGQALESSGYLSHLSYKFFRRARSLDSMVLYILFGNGYAICIFDERYLSHYRDSTCVVTCPEG